MLFSPILSYITNILWEAATKIDVANVTNKMSQIKKYKSYGSCNDAQTGGIASAIDMTCNVRKHSFRGFFLVQFNMTIFFSILINNLKQF